MNKHEIILRVVDEVFRYDRDRLAAEILRDNGIVDSDFQGCPLFFDMGKKRRIVDDVHLWNTRCSVRDMCTGFTKPVGVAKALPYFKRSWKYYGNMA